MKIKYLFIILIILMNSVSAFNYDLYSTEIIIDDKSNQFLLEGNGNFNYEDLTFELPLSINHLEVLVDGVATECTQKEIQEHTSVNCSELTGPHYIEVKFDTSYPLINFDEKTLFKFAHKINAKESYIRVELPVGAIINEERLITPQPDRIYSNGKNIILSWEEKNFNDNFELSLIFEKIQTNNNPLLLITILLLISIIVVRTIISKRKQVSNNKKIDLSFSQALLENENKIVQELSNSKNKQLWQKELQIKTKLSKVKLSRLLKSLEKRELIIKEPYGTSNIIKLKNQAEQKQKNA